VAVVVVMAPELALSHALVVAVVVMLVVVVHPIHVQLARLIRVLHVPLTHVLRVLLIHVQLVHALLNQSLVANVETLAVAKNESP